jgi:hypothetical protein
MFNLETILNKTDLDKIPKELQKNLNEAISKELTNQESETKTKFETMMVGLEERFNNYVNQAITESMNTTVGDNINKKLLGIVTGILNILESSGIPLTERTIEVSEKLKLANQSLEKAYSEVETARKELDSVGKERYIYERLQGLRPEVVSAAVEHFKNRDILEIKEEIEEYIENTAGAIPQSAEEFSDGLNNLDLDKVRDALDEINVNKGKEDLAKVKSGSKFENAAYDKLGKGLKPVKIKGKSPDVSNEELSGIENTVIESLGYEGKVSTGDVSEDTQDALDRISDFQNLGYGINLKKNGKNP